MRDIDRIIDYIDGITMASLIRKQQLERGNFVVTTVFVFLEV